MVILLAIGVFQSHLGTVGCENGQAKIHSFAERVDEDPRQQFWRLLEKNRGSKVSKKQYLAQAES